MKRAIFILMIFMSFSSFGQFPNVYSYNACNESYNGTIELNFQDALDDYPLPYNGEYYNSTKNDFEEFIVDSNPFILDSLQYGEYEFSINLSSSKIVQFCENIVQSGKSGQSEHPSPD